MPFLKQSAWKPAQQNCSDLPPKFAHISQGSKPPHKANRITDIHKYLHVLSITENRLLVVLKLDPYVHQRKHLKPS